MKGVFLTILCGLLLSCSDTDKSQKAETDHVWKEQVEVLDKAKAVEQMLQDSAALQQQKINEQTH